MSGIDKFKEEYGLSSDKAGDLKASVYNWGIVAVVLERISGTITSMEQGWTQTILLVLFLAALSFISWLTVGNIPPQMAEKVTKKMEEIEDMSPEDLVKESRNG